MLDAKLQEELFQSTLRRTERLFDEVGAIWNSNFNPRSDERSDIVAFFKALLDGISIHAPTNGATFT